MFLTRMARNMAQWLSRDPVSDNGRPLGKKSLAVPSSLTGLLFSSSSLACQHCVLCTTGSNGCREPRAHTSFSQGLSTEMLLLCVGSHGQIRCSRRVSMQISFCAGTHSSCKLNLALQTAPSPDLRSCSSCAEVKENFIPKRFL